jgi:hypothetical protein
MKPFSPPRAIDLLEQFLDAARTRLGSQPTPKAQLRLFWCMARSATSFASSDVWQAEFERLAAELGLTRHRLIGADGIEHVLSWAWRDMDPFE